MQISKKSLIAFTNVIKRRQLHTEKYIGGGISSRSFMR
jgi:hypothetical protein